MSDFPVIRILERLSALSARFSKLDAKVGSFGVGLEGKIESLRTGLTAKNDLMATRSELMARMDRLQDTMTRLPDEAFVKFAQAERIENYLKK